MVTWLLNHFSVWTLTLATVGGFAILALLGHLVVRRAFPGVSQGENNELVGALLGIFAAIYGVLLAFVIFILWDNRVAAQDTVSAEATALSQVVFNAQGLPAPQRAAILTSVDDYVHKVSTDEWASMREGHGAAPRATEALEHLRATIARYTPKNDAESAFYDGAVSSLEETATQRRTRLATSGNGPLTLLEQILIGGAIVFVPMTYLFGHRSRRAHTLFVGVSSGLIALGLLLLIVLGAPYAGDMAVDPGPYQQGTLAQFWPDAANR